MKIENLTWRELEEAIKNNPVFILSTGSIEQHGSHSTLGTDYVISKYLSEQIENMDNVVTLPAIPYGVCPYHNDFPGSFDVGYEVMYKLLFKIMNKIKEDGGKKILIINGHGGNTPAIEDSATALAKEMDILVIDWWRLAGELNPKYKCGHGDKVETSAVMAVQKKELKLEEIRKQEIKHISPNIKFINSIDAKFKNGTVKVIKNVKDVVEDGWIGDQDPKESNVKYGQDMLNEVTSYVIDLIEEFKKMV